MLKQHVWRCLAQALACAALLGCPVSLEHGQECGPANCGGCCDARGICHADPIVEAPDGGSGGRCLLCPVVAADAGSCGPESCKYGCCRGGVCLEPGGSTAAACGIAGAACVDCGTASCNSGICGQPACKFTVTALAGPDGHLLDFGSQPVGSSTALFAQVVNEGALTCKVTTLEPAASLSPVFSIVTSPSLAAGTVLIDAGHAMTITVTFKPDTPMVYLPGANAFRLETADLSPSECGAGTSLGCKQFALKGAGN